MKFIVTYCVMDNTIANPLEHACLLLSRTNEIGEKIEVVHALGFYPGPAAYPDSWSTWFLKKIGFNFEPRGNYGQLKQEEMRWLDLGYGLKGISFEITEQQFNQLNEMYQEKVANEKKAIERAALSLVGGGKIASSHTMLEEERRLARIECREPQLTAFNAGFSDAYTCKSSALDFLAAIGIPKKYLAEIANDSPSLPKYSGNVEKIILHSVGPEYKHKRDDGSFKLFRKWEDKQDKLYWSFPPQLFIKLENEGDNHEYKLPDDLVEKSKIILSQLQKIKMVVTHAELKMTHEGQRQKLTEYICNTCQHFAVFNASTPSEEIENEIEKAQRLFNSIFAAIDDECHDLNKIETVVAKIDEDSQSKICKILGQVYFKDEPKATLWM